MSSINHLKCLSAVKSMSGVLPLTPAAYPGNHCPMHTALALASKIRGLSTLVLGASECGYYSRNIPVASPYYEEALHWTYILDSKEVVFGCREGLSDAVLQMEHEGAKAILLIVTCVPEVIGEDIEGIGRGMQSQLSIPILSVSLGNFKCGSYQPGYWKTLLELGKLTQPVSQKSKTVNVLGRSVIEDHSPTPQILEMLLSKGVNIRYLAPDSSLEEFMSAADAAVSIVISPFMNPLAEQLKEMHEVELVSLHDCYDPDEIKAQYDIIFDLLDIARDSADAPQFQKAKQLQKELTEKVQGFGYIISHIGAVQSLPLAEYANRLGMNPVMINMDDFYPSDKIWREKILAQDKNPITCIMLNEQEDKPIVNSLRPNLIFGEWKRCKSEIASVKVWDLYGLIGQERTILLLEQINQAFASQEKEDA